MIAAVGCPVAVAATIYLTRDVDPRSWLSDLNLPPWLSLLLGPGKLVLLAVIVGLAAAGEARRRHRLPTERPEGNTADSPLESSE